MLSICGGKWCKFADKTHELYSTLNRITCPSVLQIRIDIKTYSDHSVHPYIPFQNTRKTNSGILLYKKHICHMNDERRAVLNRYVAWGETDTLVSTG